MNSTYTSENTLALIDFTKYIDVYDQTCSVIGIPSNINKAYVLTAMQFEKNIIFENNVKTNAELKIWSKSVCTQLIDVYIKNRADKELNIDEDIRQRCLEEFDRGNFHPSIFLEIKECVQLLILDNDVPLFKQKFLGN